MAHSEIPYWLSKVSECSKQSLQKSPQLTAHEFQPVPELGVDQRNKYKNIFFGLGVTEVILGSLCIPLALVSVVLTGKYSDRHYHYRFFHNFTYACPGIWCGIFLLITGVLGIKMKGNPSVRMLTANMVLSIISANLMAALITLSGLGALMEYYYSRDYHQSLCVFSILVTIALIGFIAGIVCIFHSAYCCAARCCLQANYHDPIALAAQSNSQQQFVMLVNGEYVPVQILSPPHQSDQSASVHSPDIQFSHCSGDQVAKGQQHVHAMPASSPQENTSPPNLR